MKKHLLFSLSGILVAGMLVVTSAFFYPDGAPAGMTGSPGDGNNCTSCHGGTATTASGWITSNIPTGGYVPGQTYQITATNGITTGSGAYGFQVSPQDLVGNLKGSLTAGTNNKLVGGGKYVTHSLAGSNKIWNFTWTAPAAGSGTVTFYGAFAHGKPGPVALSSLAITENTTGLLEIPVVKELSLYPNPCRDQVEISLAATAYDRQVVFYDVTGKEIFHSEIKANQTGLHARLNNPAKGIASVVVSSENGQIVKKLLID